MRVLVSFMNYYPYYGHSCAFGPTRINGLMMMGRQVCCSAVFSKFDHCTATPTSSAAADLSLDVGLQEVAVVAGNLAGAGRWNAFIS